jgi:hypothetical protein
MDGQGLPSATSRVASRWGRGHLVTARRVRWSPPIPRSSRASARARTCARGRTAVPTFGATVHPAGELLGTSLAAMQATAVQTNVGRFAQPSSAEASFSSYLMLRCPAQGNQGNMRHGRARLGNGYERDPNVRELRQPLAELTIVDLRKRRSHWVSWAPYDEGLVHLDSDPLFDVRWPTWCGHIYDGVRPPWVINCPDEGDAD